MPNIHNTMVLRYVVPFCFGGTGSENRYGQLTKALETAPIWNHDAPHASGALHHWLQEALCHPEDTNDIGSSWLLHTKPITLRLKDRPEAWQLSSAGMYIFRSNVGLFWYELSPRQALSLNTDELISLQNHLRDLCRTEHLLTRLMPKSSKEDPEVFNPFSLAQWTAQLLTGLSDQIRYLNGSCQKGDTLCPEKALIFCYVPMEDHPSDVHLQSTAFLLANGYTAKSPVKQVETEPFLFPFQDVCLYAAQSGCGYFARLTDDNRAFLTGSMTHTVRTEYFFLYILSLYQSFSLLHFMEQALCDFPADPSAYTQPSDSGSRLDRFSSELNTFFMKGMFSSVSSVQHHNDFFRYLRQRLQIREETENVRLGTEALVKLQRLSRENADNILREEESNKQLARDRRLNLALATISVFSLFSVFTDIDDIFSALQSLHPSAIWQSITSGSGWIIAQALVYVLVAVLSVGCIATLILSSLPSRKKKK